MVRLNVSQKRKTAASKQAVSHALDSLLDFGDYKAMAAAREQDLGGRRGGHSKKSFGMTKVVSRALDALP